MKITVLFFAKLKDYVPSPKMDMEVPENSNVQELRNIITKQFPNLVDVLPNVIVSINQQFAFNEDIILDQAEIAFFPPVSGGIADTVIDISDQPIDINKLLEESTRKSTGAAAIFTGIIRGETHGQKEYETIGLEYESYRPMAILKMEQIASEIRNKWTDVQTIVLIQRIGYMDAGTPTVVVICTSGHRNSGIFEAAKYGIDRIKEIVPVWKKEIGPNGETWIEGDYLPRKGE
jgi:molybdopterin converting factor subunit 1